MTTAPAATRAPGARRVGTLTRSIVVASLTLATPALATVGGPEVAEILGWDARESKMFFRIQYLDESGQRPGIFYFHLAGKEPHRIQRVAWSAKGPEDPSYRAKVAALRRRLKRIEEWAAPAIPLVRRVEAIDTLRTDGQGWPRYRVRFRDPDFVGGELEVTTIADSQVVVIRQYTVPGRKERFGIVAYRGLAFEMGYEVQVPVLMPREGEARVVASPLR